MEKKYQKVQVKCTFVEMDLFISSVVVNVKKIINLEEYQEKLSGLNNETKNIRNVKT